jgi:hypothetical protein
VIDIPTTTEPSGVSMAMEVPQMSRVWIVGSSITFSLRHAVQSREGHRQLTETLSIGEGEPSGVLWRGYALTNKSLVFEGEGAGHVVIEIAT